LTRKFGAVHEVTKGADKDFQAAKEVRPAFGVAGRVNADRVIGFTILIKLWLNIITISIRQTRSSYLR
jgi:hypothetical protein